MAACFFGLQALSSCVPWVVEASSTLDGFNFYYGAVRGTSDKWLNIQRLCERLRQDDDIQTIKYFTAIVNGPTQANQLVYLRALETCPKVHIVLGKFKNKNLTCRVASCTYSGPRRYVAAEEKRTDVSIAVHLVDDAYQDAADRFVVISGDSDLVPALNVTKLRFPEKQLIVYVPTRNTARGAAVELRSAADKNRTFPLALLPRCQFPVTLPDGHGGTITKPSAW